VLNAHVNNSPNAKHSAHDLERSVTRSRVSARKSAEAATEDVVGNLPAYLAGYLLNYGENLEELPESQLAGAAVMWSTGTQSVRPDQRAQQWMRLDQDDDQEESPWILAGIERDGEFHPASDDPARGGVATFVTSTDNPPPVS
jgi:hypothetical protein